MFRLENELKLTHQGLKEFKKEGFNSIPSTRDSFILHCSLEVQLFVYLSKPFFILPACSRQVSFNLFVIGSCCSSIEVSRFKFRLLSVT